MRKIAALLLLCLTLGLVPGVSASETQNLFTNNADFRSWYLTKDTYLRLSGWSGTWGTDQNLSQSTDIYKSAPYALKMEPEKNNGDAFVYQRLEVLPGAEYTLGFWFYGIPGKDNEGNVRVKFEFYYKDEAGSMKSVSGAVELKPSHEKDGEWTYIETPVVIPLHANHVSPMIRLKNKAAGYVDDASFIKTGDPQHATGTTDQIFYYKEEIEAGKCGEAEIKMNGYYNAADFTAAVKLLNPEGETVFESNKQSFADGVALLSFPLTALSARMKTAFTAQLCVYGEEAEPVWIKEQSVYGYARPSAIGEDGLYRTDGVLFQPTVGYHINLPPSGAVPGPDTAEGTDWFDIALEAGVNVVQLSYYYGDPGRIKAALDRCQQYGLKALICLYRNNFPAGNTTELIKNSAGEMVTNAENTPEVVKIAKEHPATFAYAVKDEPFSHMTEDMYGELENGYRLIRNEDDVHPVYIVDTTVSKFDTHAKYVDIMGIDPYPQSPSASATYVTDRIRKAVAAADGKPVYAILQACRYGDTDDDGKNDYFPTGVELRHMAYQALAAGAKAIGYYAFTDPVYENGNRVPLMDTDLWEPITDFAANEQEKAYAFFRESQLGRTIETDEILLQTRTLQNKTYAVVMSKRNAAQTDASDAVYGEIANVYVGTGDASGSMRQLSVSPYSVGIYELQKENALFVTQRNDDGSIAAEAILETESAKSVTLVAAMYDESTGAKEFLSMHYMDRGTAENGKLTLSGTVSVPETSPADTLALFLFSDELLRPAGKSATVEIGA